jgi:hypothetical protein
MVLFAGEIVSLVAGVLHPAGEDPNNHAAVFAAWRMKEARDPLHNFRPAG